MKAPSRRGMFKDLGQDIQAPSPSAPVTPKDAERIPLSTAPTSLRFTHAMKDIGKRASEAEALERELAAVKAGISSGSHVIEVDPALIDPSPIRDRMDGEAGDEESLRASILETGQQIPVLLRPSDQEAGRYVTVFGHRRVATVRMLGLKVRAIVTGMSEHDALVAQGVENAERRDLTYIEKARFALRLSEAGLTYDRIGVALGTAKPHVSDMIKVASTLPDFVIDAIGRAPKLGAPRWKQLAAAAEAAGGHAVRTCKDVVGPPAFADLDAESRFRAVASALSACVDNSERTQAPHADLLSDQQGVVFGTARRKASGGLTIDLPTESDLAFRADGTSFADWLILRMQALREEWRRNE